MRDTAETLDDDQRYQAAASKDARFDGVFFVAVTTTGIYCRPSCPAITPKRRNVQFYRSAAAAQDAGFAHASGAAPMPRPVRRSGTSGPTWWHARCG